jgi:hypothetical protein
MRRIAVVAATLFTALWFATPAQAFAHNNVLDPTLHTILESLTLLVATSPIWTALLWRGPNRWWLATLIAVVQIPVAVIGFMPIVNPALHISLFIVAMALTGTSLYVIRRQPVPAARSAADRP